MRNLNYDPIYKMVENTIHNLNMLEKEILDNVISMTPDTLIKRSETRRLLIKELDTVRLCLYHHLTAEEIKAVVAEEEVGDWYKTKLNRQYLPKDIYCNHQQWLKDEKLQALMPAYFKTSTFVSNAEDI